MSTLAVSAEDAGVDRPRFEECTHLAGKLAFLLVLLGALAFVGYSMLRDTRFVGEPLTLGAVLTLPAAITLAGGLYSVLRQFV